MQSGYGGVGCYRTSCCNVSLKVYTGNILLCYVPSQYRKQQACDWRGHQDLTWQLLSGIFNWFKLCDAFTVSSFHLCIYNWQNHNPAMVYLWFMGRSNSKLIFPTRFFSVKKEKCWSWPPLIHHACVCGGLRITGRRQLGLATVGWSEVSVTHSIEGRWCQSSEVH